jgi:hypothetical protein
VCLQANPNPFWRNADFQDESSGRWLEVGDAVAREKVGQLLRELLAKKEKSPSHPSRKREYFHEQSDTKPVASFLSRPRSKQAKTRKRGDVTGHANRLQRSPVDPEITNGLPTSCIMRSDSTVVSELNESSELSMQSDGTCLWEL